MKAQMALLVLDEGCSEIPYLCTAKKWTIGVGRNLEGNPLTRDEIRYLLDHGYLDMRLAREGALYLLEQEVRKVRVDLMRYVQGWHKCNEARQAALVSMGFMGVNRLLGFKQMLAAIAAGDWDEAARQAADSQWYRQVGERGPRIVAMLKTGEWPREIV